jgi:hypothetical protein
MNIHEEPTEAFSPSDETTYRFILDERTRKQFYLNESTGKFSSKMILFITITVSLFMAVPFIILSLLYPEVLKAWKIICKVIIVNLFLRPDIGAFWFLLFTGFALLHSHLRKISIVMDEKGVTFNGFLFANIEKHYGWHEFAQIRSSHFRGNDVIVFIDRYGKSFRIQFGKEEAELPQKKPCFRLPRRGERPPRPFVGDGHPFSLPDIIERFYAPVTPLNETERRKIPALTGFSWDTGSAGRVGHLALAVLCMVFLNIVLRIHNINFFLLETWQSQSLILGYWLVGGLGFVFSWHYLRDFRQKESWESTWIVSLSFAACLWFLVTPAAILLPLYLGEARQETFFVPRTQDVLYPNRQYWHSVNEPERLSFWVDIPHKQRQYKPGDPGAQREFTVYRGPLGFYAMPFTEIKPLWTEKSAAAGEEDK